MELAQALDRLGLNYGSNTGPPGALEKLAMAIRQPNRITDALGRE